MLKMVLCNFNETFFNSKSFVSPWPQVWCEGEQKTAYWTTSSFLETVFSPFLDSCVMRESSFVDSLVSIDSLLTNLLVDSDCSPMSVNSLLVDPLKSTQEYGLSYPLEKLNERRMTKWRLTKPCLHPRSFFFHSTPSTSRMFKNYWNIFFSNQCL